MEGSSKARGGRKRYCCCYCNVYFHQIDSWQRHNRKHTGVEIECDDCGEMCSDSFELKSHQQLCEAYRVYSEERFTQDVNLSSTDRHLNEQSSPHDTPDSTSKQELTNETESESTWRSRNNDETKSPVPNINEESNSKTNPLELDDLIGEDRDSSNAMEEASEIAQPQEEGDDPETEALIGLDETISNMKSSSPSSNNMHKNVIALESQMVIKVESALHDAKRDFNNKMDEKDERPLDAASFLAHASHSVAETIQSVTLESADLNKKYQPYFCKNCGARFTRKDSVTRHLKKGTCSGKAAIVCNICGKVFPELYELQKHFELDHKNVMFAPPAVSHRTILPKPSDHSDQSRRHQQQFSSFSTPYVLRDQHFLGSRNVPPPPHPPGLQNVFYPPPSAQSSHRQQHQQRNGGYSPANKSGQYREHNYPPGRQYDGCYQSSALLRKESTHKADKAPLMRKREYGDYHHSREHFSEKEDSYYSKRSKVEFIERNDKLAPYSKNESSKNQINLSEYTNNAMNSRQYLKRFTPKDGSVVAHENDSVSAIHECNICGSEFPRYEYLLTHLRKHREKHERDDVDVHKASDCEKFEIDQNLSDSYSPENGDKRLPVHDSKKGGGEFDNNEPLPVVAPQITPSRFIDGIGVHPKENFYPPQPSANDEALPMYAVPSPSQQLEPGVVNESTLEAITPGVDGKFRPFTCPRCGQRFTRKDSLVRHTKKQTCFEEADGLKCKHCDKTFRYHKCLSQHQEIVHGIVRDEEKNMSKSSDGEDTDSDRSDKNDNYIDEKRVALVTPYEMQRNFRSPNTMLDIKPNVHHHQQAPQRHYSSPHLPLSSRALSFVNPSFRNVEPQNPSAKFIPSRPEEKMKAAPLLHDEVKTSNPVNIQSTEYIGYSTVPRPFQCDYCGDRFAHRHSLKRHIRKHLGIGILCTDCKKIYRDQSEWRRHQRTIHNKHYEKHEVPSRMSLREGMESGMIGMVPSSAYKFDSNDGSESDRSDEDMSMVKKGNKLSYVHSHRGKADEKSSSPNVDKNFEDEDRSRGEEKEANLKNDDKENMQAKKPPFNLKLLDKAGDKDSRKSALDRYLRYGDDEDVDEDGDGDGDGDGDEDVEEEEGHARERKEKHDGEVKEAREEASLETNNNNNLEDKNKLRYYDNTTEMVTVDTSY